MKGWLSFLVTAGIAAGVGFAAGHWSPAAASVAAERQAPSAQHDYPAASDLSAEDMYLAAVASRVVEMKHDGSLKGAVPVELKGYIQNYFQELDRIDKLLGVAIAKGDVGKYKSEVLPALANAQNDFLSKGKSIHSISNQRLALELGKCGAMVLQLADIGNAYFMSGVTDKTNQLLMEFRGEKRFCTGLMQSL